MTWLAETVMLSHGWRRVLILLVAGAIAALSVPPLFILPALFVARQRNRLGDIFLAREGTQVAEP